MKNQHKIQFLALRSLFIFHVTFVKIDMHSKKKKKTIVGRSPRTARDANYRQIATLPKALEHECGLRINEIQTVCLQPGRLKMAYVFTCVVLVLYPT